MTELGHYLAELKARLLVLAEKPDITSAQLRDLLEVVHAAYVQRFKQSAINPAVLVQALIDCTDRDDQTLRELADSLQPWATPKAPAVQSSQEPTIVESVVESPIVAVLKPRVIPRPHNYNSDRFGSQESLLELLQRQSDSGKSALELIEILR